MILILIAISVITFILSVLISLSEAWHEKDWPRDTVWFPVVFGCTTLILIAAA